DDFQKVSTFGEKVATYFPNYVGVAGTGFYVDENLQKLSLELPIEFFGQAEVIGFTQYVYGQVKEIFPNDYDIEVTISSRDRKSTRLNSSHVSISYAVFCLKKKQKNHAMSDQ